MAILVRYLSCLLDWIGETLQIVDEYHVAVCLRIRVVSEELFPARIALLSQVDVDQVMVVAVGMVKAKLNVIDLPKA